MKKRFVGILAAIAGLVTPIVADAQFLSPYGACDLDFQVQDSASLCDYFLTTPFRFLLPSPHPPTSMIINKDLEVVWYKRHQDWTLDFKRHPDGRYSYCEKYDWVVLDSAFAVQDTFHCIGYTTDPHDFAILPNGNVLMICYEDTIVDLRALLTTNGMPGDSAGHLLATVIQEQTPQHQVVKNWHAFGPYSIFDADPEFFTNPTRMELNHSNSVDLNPDGRLLMSNRANHDLACIDWNTGQLLWRLGGFSGNIGLVNDNPMSAQHDARWLPDGKVSVFDNGTLNNPYEARGLVYEVDTVNETATLTWEHANPTIHSDGLGSFRVLPNGSGILNYGSIVNGGQDDVLLIKADSTLGWLLDMENSFYSYRSICQDIPVPFDRPELICDMVGGQMTLTVAGQPAQVLWADGQTSSSITVTAAGQFQAFVPLGIGWVGTKVWNIVDPLAGCAVVSMPEPSEPRQVFGGKEEFFDLLGRPVKVQAPGQLLIRKSGNQTTKVISW